MGKMIQYRRERRKLCLMYNMYHGHAPSYLFLSVRPGSKCPNTRRDFYQCFMQFYIILIHKFVVSRSFKIRFCSDLSNNIQFRGLSFLVHQRSMWTIAITCRPSSVVCKLFTFQASSPKPLGQLEPNLAGMFLGWSSTKFLFFVPVGYSTDKFTDDGHQVMAIVPMDLWSRWTKKIVNQSVIVV
jgi:hypothetical protein